MKSHFSTNLKSLRKNLGLTQNDLAQKLGMTRAKLGSYEEGRAEPSLALLEKIANFFAVSIDALIALRIEKPEENSNNLLNKELRVLPIVVDQENRERISMVPINASAGYLNGYADPQFIEELPHFHLPIKDFSQGTFRAFQLKGDSMLPVPSGALVIAEYLENWNWLQDHKCYIILSKTEGIVYKRAINLLEEEQCIELHSDNPDYSPYKIQGPDILEIWSAKAIVNFEIPSAPKQDPNVSELSKMLLELKAEVDQLKENN